MNEGTSLPKNVIFNRFGLSDLKNLNITNAVVQHDGIVHDENDYHR